MDVILKVDPLRWLYLCNDIFHQFGLDGLLRFRYIFILYNGLSTGIITFDRNIYFLNTFLNNIEPLYISLLTLFWIITLKKYSNNTFSRILTDNNYFYSALVEMRNPISMPACPRNMTNIYALSP